MIQFFGLGTISLMLTGLALIFFGYGFAAMVAIALGIICLMLTLAMIDDCQIDHPEELAFDPSFELARDYLQAQRDLDEAARRAQDRGRDDGYPGEVQHFPPWL